MLSIAAPLRAAEGAPCVAESPIVAVAAVAMFAIFALLVGYLAGHAGGVDAGTARTRGARSSPPMWRYTKWRDHTPPAPRKD
jgi:hypothetical protein